MSIERDNTKGAVNMIKGQTRTTTIAGNEFTVWSDFIARGTFAENEAGDTKQISFSGYVKNDLATRKAIQAAFQLDSFKK